MLKLRTLEDINSLIPTKEYNQSFINYIRDYFSELFKNLAETDDSIESFSLEKHGDIVLIESSDDVTNLKDVGLGGVPNGFLGTSPEFVNIIDLKTQPKYYQVGVLYNNEYMMIFYYPKSKSSNPNVISFLDEYLI